MDDQIRALNEYVYMKYVDGARVEDLDEPAVCAQLQEHYNRPENAADTECVYLGILCFELGYEIEERQEELFRQAKRWLDRHKTGTGEAWDAVDDRLLDLDEYFEQHGLEVEPDNALASAVAPVVVEEIEDHGRMMLVPAGAFLFGAENDRVTLPPYYIDKFPVTNREYEAFCRATGYRFPKYWSEDRFRNPDAPVVGVSLSDAQKFARWVGKQLPSEEQWEKACRGVDGRLFPWGDDAATAEHACFGRDAAKGATDPVESHPLGFSPYGVGEMAGNVWEWTGTESEEGDSANVIKGGCYNDPPELLRGAVRLEAAPKDKFENIGFRCVKSA
ncbi:MAG: SUMF1/EgtB/PvdO family nonheme iron enzyme [Planctomycetota bacterium]|nr:SUMF1/EgtB/PvdO family nonheme iron enzyme [Planctomycetota bacterium]